ncbi:hypothetical protein H1P_1880004 [Hyella patelloides LEGE 07179]|uniref:Uncharacterized protein n=1 Tax=Hyella patelloides LEGE 07179 TaxID=945734 RepID=A0A563VNZ6_9CYAN|nr:hypothetical protein H1P_1880004 [Hyella patelloides LEGE 07179]
MLHVVDGNFKNILNITGIAIATHEATIIYTSTATYLPILVTE